MPGTSTEPNMDSEDDNYSYDRTALHRALQKLQAATGGHASIPPCLLLLQGVLVVVGFQMVLAREDHEIMGTWKKLEMGECRDLGQL
jgi:hypothetical protein